MTRVVEIGPAGALLIEQDGQWLITRHDSIEDTMATEMSTAKSERGRSGLNESWEGTLISGPGWENLVEYALVRGRKKVISGEGLLWKSLVGGWRAGACPKFADENRMRRRWKP